MTFTVTQLSIPDVLVIEPKVFSDERGFFLESFRASLCQQHNLPAFVQDNHSHSKRHVLRGLHYQLNPRAMGKLVRCARGEILDVAVDIRVGSPHYGKWISRTLRADEGNALWVPPGFAHGFLTLEDDTYVMYKCAAPWSAESERTIRYDDSSLGIDWPFEPLLVNQKDLDASKLSNVENNFVM